MKIDRKVLLILLFAALAVQLGRHFNDFYVPESDFFDYREKAIALRGLEQPENFKRPPLYPVAVAVLSAPLSGKMRELYAAELVVALSALFSLFFVYRIGKYFLGQHAFWLAWLWAMHPTTLRMAVKPKPEMFVTVLILWAFDRFLKGDRKAYLIAFLATMVRYEGAIAILAFFVADFLFTKERVKSFALALLAGLPLVLWTLLHSEGTAGGSYGNYFNNYHPNFAFLITFWDGLLRFLPVSFFKLWTLLGLALLGIGLWQTFGKLRKETTALFVFLVGFGVMHIIWPFSNIDYIVIVAWNAFLFILLGIRWVGERTKARFEQPLASRWFGAIGVIFLVASLGFVLSYRFPFPQYNVDPLAMATFLVPVLLYLAWQGGADRRAVWQSRIWSAALVLVLAFWLNSKTNGDFFDIHYSKAEFRKVGEWFEQNYTPGAKLAVAQPKVVAFFTHLDAERNFIRLIDVPPGSPEEIHKWLAAHQATYIAWLSTNKVYEKGDAWYSWKRDNRGWRTIKFLEDGVSRPGFEMVKEIRIGPRWAYVYRLGTMEQPAEHEGG